MIGLRNFLSIFLIFGILIGFLAPQMVSSANPAELERQIEQVRRERETLIEEQRKLQAELEAINREAQTLGTAVKSLDAAKKKLEADINVTQSRIKSTDLVISSLENNIGDKERKITVHRKAIAETINALRDYDSRPMILDLLSSASFADIWGDRGRLESLSDRLEGEIKDLRQTREDLNREKSEREKVREEQLSLRDQLGGQKTIVEENQKAKESLLAETKNRESEYQKLLNENLANQRQFEEDLYQLQSQLRITLDPSLIPEPRPGLLSWPLDNVFVTQKFGDTAFARTGAYNGRGHNGVDFRAAMGTPVKTMLSGVIEGQGNTDEMNAELRRQGKPICGSYGRWILVKHNNGLSSVYVHLSASIVRIGQTVKTGEIIGYSGGQPGVNGSGYSTGPHLHVGLFASQGVEIRQFTTSINCKHTFVPIADLKAYLDPLSYLPAL